MIKNENNEFLVAGTKRRFGPAKPPLQSLPAIRKIAITIGDAGGIGAEVIIKAVNSPELSVNSDKFILIGSRDLFQKTAYELGFCIPEKIEIFDIPLDISKIVVGKPTKESGKHSFLALKQACKMAKSGLITAIVTAPVSKEAINQAGYFYSGQTEIFRDFLKKGRTSSPEMLFVADNLRVMLLTRHVKIDSITSELSLKGIIKSITALNNSLINDFKITAPRIAICGLNPHAGENSILGHEEDYIIKPAMQKLKLKFGIDVEGPFPADTLWAKTAKLFLKGEKLPYDAYVACYHDQGLIPVKMLAMEKAVNTTINLSIIRTSPSHGTAYDIAGQNKADSQSMIEAVKLAEELISKRKKYNKLISIV